MLGAYIDALAAFLVLASIAAVQQQRFQPISADPVTAVLRRPHWGSLPSASRDAAFLLSLVLSASMMPVSELPRASAATACGLGFVSAVFDNIPLTKLAIEQGGYDWGLLAFCVGFGGSMVWFGSSAGVAISNTFSHARSVGQWLRHGWHVILAYIVGFAVFMLIHGWQPLSGQQSAPVQEGSGQHRPLRPAGWCSLWHARLAGLEPRG